MHTGATTEISSQSSTMHESEPLAEWVALLECATLRSKAGRLASFIRDSFNWPLFLQSAEDHGLTLLVAERVKNLDRALDPAEPPVHLRRSHGEHAVCAAQRT